MANKVKYGLSNCYYAVLDEAEGTYSTPVALPGAVNLSLDQEGEDSNFRADNIDYFRTFSNNGYTGTLELALIPDAFLKDVLGQVKDSTSGLQYEIADANPSPFALLFQFEGDANATRHVLYNCKASRPQLSSQTTEETISPVTETIDITAIARTMTVGGATKQIVKAKCEPTDTAYSSFFTSVQMPSAT